MSYESLKEAVVGLPDDKLVQLIEYAQFLKQSVGQKKAKSDKLVYKRKIGMMKEGFISIAPDFDDCLEGWEDYI